MSKQIAIIFIILSLGAYVKAAASLDGACSTTDGGTTAGDAPGQGVKTCSTYKVATCQAGFYLSATPIVDSTKCLECAAGQDTTDGNTATACTDCGAGKYAPATVYATHDGTAKACTICAIGTFGPDAAMATCTSCTGGAYCDATSMTAPKWCDVGKGSVAGSDAAADCTVTCATTAGFSNCSTTSDVTRCQDGFFITGTTSCTACKDTNCKTCTTASDGACTACKSTFGLDSTQSAAATQCVTCGAGCDACSSDGTKVTCTSTSAGYKLVNGAATQCAASEFSMAGATACTACDATAAFCTSCQDTATFCTACQENYSLDTTTGVCSAILAANIHASCQSAGIKDSLDGCMSCQDGDNRTMELDTPVAPATTGVAQTIGKCLCKPGYGDQSKLSTPDYVCQQCPANTSDCKIGATGITEVTCNSGFFKAGLNCLTSSAVDVVGFFWDTSATTSAFKACTATLNCLSCNATACLKCSDLPSSWSEPTSSSSNYATYIKAKAIVNGACVSDCLSPFTPNSAKTGCVAGSAAASNAFSKLYAVFALIASLLIIF